MSFSEVSSFTEPGEFAAAIRGSKVELCLLAPGLFNGKITHIELNALHINRASESHPHILHSTNTSGRAVIAFLTEPGPGVFRGGIEMKPNSIARAARFQSCFHRAVGPTCWGTMSLPVEQMHMAGIVAGGCDLMPPSNELIVTPPPGAIAKLRQLHSAAGILAETAPDVIAHPEVAHGLEQALTEAMVACLGTVDKPEGEAAARRHRTIMRRFHTVLHADVDRALYVLEIAEAIGASVRTLSACCQEHLGMGPKKYLLLRRMHLTRQALSRADSRATSVTDVATQYGFWQFGRFAVEYKSLFGESPSVTLRRTPEELKH